ncbi:MAG: hypothetical protein IPL49_18050 [Saprospirales bacterium]|nr:hypothetical protein [Saprospirales bacterium]
MRRVLDLVGDPGNELAQRGQFVLDNQFLLGIYDFFVLFLQLFKGDGKLQGLYFNGFSLFLFFFSLRPFDLRFVFEAAALLF